MSAGQDKNGGDSKRPVLESQIERSMDDREQIALVESGNIAGLKDSVVTDRNESHEEEINEIDMVPLQIMTSNLQRKCPTQERTVFSWFLPFQNLQSNMFGSYCGASKEECIDGGHSQT